MKVISQNKTTLAAALLAALASQTVFAGGFDDATNMATIIRNGVYAVVSILAGMVILWNCFEGMQHRKQWGDILITCLWAVATAASVAFTAYLFTKGQSMTFS